MKTSPTQKSTYYLAIFVDNGHITDYVRYVYSIKLYLKPVFTRFYRIGDTNIVTTKAVGSDTISGFQYLGVHKRTQTDTI